jgi:hypothetical protein
MIKSIGVLFSKVLDDVREVVASPREALLRASLRLTARIINRKIGNIPTRNELAQCGDT